MISEPQNEEAKTSKWVVKASQRRRYKRVCLYKSNNGNNCVCSFDISVTNTNSNWPTILSNRNFQLSAKPQVPGIPSHAVTAYERAEVQLHSFLISALAGGEWSDLLPGRFTHRVRAHKTQFSGKEREPQSASRRFGDESQGTRYLHRLVRHQGTGLPKAYTTNSFVWHFVTGFGWGGGGIGTYYKTTTEEMY